LPRRRRHELGCRLLLGKPYSWVHRLKDSMWRVDGPKHRRWWHNRATNIAVALLLGDPKAFLAGELHDLMDRMQRDKRVKKRNRR